VFHSLPVTPDFLKLNWKAMEIKRLPVSDHFVRQCIRRCAVDGMRNGRIRWGLVVSSVTLLWLYWRISKDSNILTSVDMSKKLYIFLLVSIIFSVSLLLLWFSSLTLLHLDTCFLKTGKWH
jgi:hypothetical protein